MSAGGGDVMATLRRHRSLIAIMLVAVGLASGAAAAGETGYWAQATCVRGSVTVVEAAAMTPRALARGDVLAAGAVVRTGDAARATFLLADGALLVIPAQTERTLAPAVGAAPPSLAAVARELARTVVAQGEGEPLLKHLGGLREGAAELILVPRRTRIRGGSTELSWSSRDGITRYAVRVLGPTGTVLEQQVTGTRLVIPAATLSPGAGYVWEVRDAAEPDSLVPLGAATFAVLDEPAAAAIADQEVRLAALASELADDDTTAAYLHYQLLRDAELYLEAAGVLDELVDADPADGRLAAARAHLRNAVGLATGDDGSDR